MTIRLIMGKNNAIIDDAIYNRSDNEQLLLNIITNKDNYDTCEHSCKNGITTIVCNKQVDLNDFDGNCESYNMNYTYIINNNL